MFINCRFTFAKLLNIFVANVHMCFYIIVEYERGVFIGVIKTFVVCSKKFIVVKINRDLNLKKFRISIEHF